MTDAFEFKQIKDNSEAYEVLASSTEIKGEIIVPASFEGKPVIKIGWGAFKNCKGITSAIIPDSITGISLEAFMGCTGLTDFTMPDSVVEISNGIFKDCTNLKTIKLSSRLESIPFHVFQNCSSLTKLEIPQSVTKIFENVFYDCLNLTEIIIPPSVTYLASFHNTGLWNNTPENEVIYAGNYAVGYKGTIDGELILKPDTIGVGNGAFASQKKLSSITLNDKLINICGNAFEGCTGLTQIVIPESVKYIGYEAFSGCTRLTQVIIPESVSKIENKAFWNCRKVKELTLPNKFKGKESKFINLNFNAVNEVEKMIKKHKRKKDFFTGATDEQIEKTEAALGLKFPAEYRKFVQQYGAGGICGVEIKGIESDTSASVVTSTERWRALGLAQNYIVIEDSGEFVMCMNGTDNDPCVYIEDRAGLADKNLKPNKQYDSFFDYLYETFEDAIDNQ